MILRPASILPTTNYYFNAERRVVQVNLKRSTVTSDNVLALLREEDIDVGITKEPWTRDSTVMGFNKPDYNALYKTPQVGRDIVLS